jgi:hypothetical protein
MAQTTNVLHAQKMHGTIHKNANAKKAQQNALVLIDHTSFILYMTQIANVLHAQKGTAQTMNMLAQKKHCSTLLCVIDCANFIIYCAHSCKSMW